MQPAVTLSAKHATLYIEEENQMMKPTKGFSIFEAKCDECGHFCVQLVPEPNPEKILSKAFECCRCGRELGNGHLHAHRPHRVIDG